MLPLDASSQERLLECAEQGRWKVRRMRQEVARHLAATPPATGRPKKPPVYRTLTGLGSKSAFDGKDELLAFDDSKVATLLRHCNHALGELGEVRSFLEEAVSKREPARVLVVSSDRAFLYRARQRLRLPGCRIHVAASCEEAMLRMDSATRCAVIDPFLVDGCGLELAERLTAACRDLQCFLTDRPKSRLSKKLDADPARSPIVRKASGLWPLRVALAKALSARERNGSKPARITR
jgi:CheY-like chemotaxis protein